MNSINSNRQMDNQLETNEQDSAKAPHAPTGDFHHYGSNSQPVILTTKISSLDYNMNHKTRGYCLIFDITDFRTLPKRNGSERDSTGLYNLFRSLSFDVFVFKNLTANNIKAQLKYFANLDHSNSDCFTCCIMTHGEHGQLWGTDTRFPNETLFQYFVGDNCKTLVGKPKLFFIQACQGDRLDNGVSVVGADRTDATSYFRIPNYADFLIAYSTLPGFYSWRNSQDGSWFIQAVIRVLNDYHLELDLLSMMTIVNHNVAFYKQSNASTLEFSDKKQVPCITSMLTRRIFIKPKKIFF